MTRTWRFLGYRRWHPKAYLELGRVEGQRRPIGIVGKERREIWEVSAGFQTQAEQ